jgi:hypothetical protein
MNVIGTAIDQKPTEDGNHRAGCRTAMWKERRKHDIMISKQQPTKAYGFVKSIHMYFTSENSGFIP